MELFLHGNGAAATIYFGVVTAVRPCPDHHSDDLKGRYNAPFRTYGLCMSDYRQVNRNCRLHFHGACCGYGYACKIFCYFRPFKMSTPQDWLRRVWWVCGFQDYPPASPVPDGSASRPFRISGSNSAVQCGCATKLLALPWTRPPFVRTTAMNRTKLAQNPAIHPRSAAR